MASGLLRPVRRRQFSDQLLRPCLLGESAGWFHDSQNSSAGSFAGQHRSESTDTAGPAAGRGRGRGRGQALPGLGQDRGAQPDARGPGGGRQEGRAGPPPGPRAPGQGRPGAGRGRFLRQPEEQQGFMQPRPRPRPEGFRQGDRQMPGSGPRGRGGPGQGGQQGRRPPRMLPGEVQPGEQASGRYDDADEADAGQSQQRRRGRRAGAPGRTPRPDSAMVRAEPEGPGRGPGAGTSPARGARGSRQQYGDMVPDSLAESSRSFGARSRRQDTTWQGFRTEQEEQRLRDMLQSIKESLRSDDSAEIRPGPWSLDVHPDEGPIPEPFELEADYDRMMKLEALDPQLVMDFGGPPPPRQPVPKMEPAELLEHFKPQIMQTLGFEGDEDTWQEVIEGQAEMAVAMRDRKDQIKSRDIWGEIEEVKALVDELMPQDHPYRGHVDMSVESMHSNSSYTLEQKVYQVKHLIHSLTSPLPQRLRTRGLLGMHAEM